MKSIGIVDKTVAKYVKILEVLYIIKLIPSYSNNILKQVIKSPKVHVIDSGLASYLLNTSVESLMVYYDNLIQIIEACSLNGRFWIPELIVISLLSEWIIEEKTTTY